MHYTDQYPDTLPSLSLEAVEGELDGGEIDELLAELRVVVRDHLFCPDLSRSLLLRGKRTSGWR